MSNFIPLENIRVAAPCRADWNHMEGDDRVRHCQSCAKNVYNLSEMSREAAEKLIAEKEGDLCVRFYQRADGTIITDNCPVGLKIVRRPFKWLIAGFAALMASGAAIAAQGGSTPGVETTPQANFDVRNFAPVRFIMDRFDGTGSTPTAPVMGGIAPIMGKPICPNPNPTPSPVEPEPKE
jgi:hypothetical protein